MKTRGFAARAASPLNPVPIHPRSILHARSQRIHRARTDGKGRIDWPHLPAGAYMIHVDGRVVHLDSSRTGHVIDVSAQQTQACQSEDSILWKDDKHRNMVGDGELDKKAWAHQTIERFLITYVHKRRRFLHHCAAVVQVRYKRYFLRKTKAARIMQKYIRSTMEYRAYKRLLRTIIKVQAHVKKMMTNRMLARHNHAIMLIQRMLNAKRGVMAKMKTVRRATATRIQKHWRRILVQYRYRRLVRPAIFKIQRVTRAQQLRHHLQATFKPPSPSVQVKRIQRVWRGFRVRALIWMHRTGALRYRSTHRWWAKTPAATKIQCAVRCIQARATKRDRLRERNLQGQA